MKKSLLLFILFLTSNIVFCQEYNITSFQSSYDTLTNYKSLTQEIIVSGEDPFIWSGELELGFDFPFFDEIFQKAIIYSIGSIGLKEDVGMALFACASYTIDSMLTPDSEIRYKSLVQNGKKALAVEFHNVYHVEEYELNGKNHYLNFQYWLFENGTIQLRFGDIDLDNCSYFVEGKGFLADPSNTDFTFGPITGINSNENNIHCIFGAYEDLIISYGSNYCKDPLTTIPPSGSVIQFAFANDTTSVQDFFYDKKEKNKFTVTSSHNTLFIDGNQSKFSNAYIFDAMGRLIQLSNEPKIIMNEMSTNQIIFVQIIAENHMETHKVLLK